MPHLPASAVRRRSPKGAWWTTIHGAFDRVASRFPSAPAVEQAGEVLRYEALAAASRRMAARLAAAGVGPGDVVGVRVGRSAEFVVAVLAILRRGAAYAPLPGEYPLPRLLGMLEDADVRVLVADEAAATTAAALARGRPGLVQVPIDAATAWAGAIPGAAPDEAAVGPESPAYVMFTSGSTGRPRGVVVPHRAVTGLVTGQSYADFGRDLRTLLLAPTAFDASTFELWAPLLHGGTAVVHADEDVDPARLGEVLRAGRVNCLWLTAGLFNVVVDLEPSALAGVAHVLTGGDVLSVPHVRRAFAALPGVRITNGYGPTETTTFACTHAIDPEDLAADGAIPIGRPLAHTECVVVDGQGRPVDDGVEGELWIGGSGVALGYLSGDRSRFVADPRGGTDPFYRSGDRCRRRADGTFLFLGRVDREVKIRGHRVDPSDLETTLAGHPAVRAAAALPFGPDGDRSLGVALVRRDARTVPVERLREWLAERLQPALLPARIVSVPSLPVTPNGKLDRDALRGLFESGGRAGGSPAAGSCARVDAIAALLPGPMVPSRIVHLAAFPVTANGKLDRAALPEPDARESRAAAEPPRGGVETLLAALWRDLLGRETVGRDDDFFDAGGNSLAAMRLVARIEAGTGVRLAVRTVFDRPRLADLAAVIEAARPGVVEPVASDAIAAPRVPIDLPALPAQRGMWALQDRLPDRATYNQPFAFRVGAPLDPESLRAAAAAMMERHPALRSRLVASPSGPIQRILPVGAVEVDWVVEPGTGPAAIDAALRDHARRPFDLDGPPLWRVRFFPAAAPHGVILFVFHHALIDDWSVSLFLDELAALSAGIPLPPTAPACTIAAPDRRRRETVVGFWKRELDGVPAAPRLPGGRSVEGAGAPGGILRRSLGGLAEEVRRASRAAGGTVAQWTLAVFHAWLQRVTAATDVVVLTPLSLRGMGVAEDAFGCYLNTVPVRVRWGDDAGARPAKGMVLPDIVERVRRTLIEAGDHADLPFDEIVSESCRGAQRGGPLADVMVVVTGGGPRSWRIGDAALEPLPCDTATAKFGATFFFDVRGDDVELAVEYATAVYDGAIVAAHLSTLAAFLRGAIRAPETSIESLPLAEVPGADATGTRSLSAPRDLQPIHTAAIGYACTAPDLPAVIAGPRTLSYSELDDWSRALASRFTDLGSQPEERVGICLPRGASSCVALLGVLRAGGVCVPLDPTLPVERLRRMVAIAGVRFVVSAEATAHVVAALGAVVPVPVEGLPPAPRFVDPPVSLDALAFVLFTSGSTGDPKGVEMPHGPLAALFDWQTRSTPRSPGDRTLHFASTGFDAAFQEVFSAWAAGCTVVVADEDARRDPARLVELVVRERVDRMILPTAMLVPFAEAVIACGTVPTLVRDVIVAGEPLHIAAPVRRLFRSLPGCTLWNHYGPTESHVVTAHGLEGPPEAWPDHPPIGKPIDGAVVTIEGPDGGHLPPCCVGEIVLGGGCLARGYASRPDLTAERFRGDAGTARSGRTYRTGDLGWIRPDGAIECLGRNDRQLKISGHRIEPGEVEAALAACPGVRRAAVIARRDGGAAVRLVAFLEVAAEWPGGAATRAALRVKLAEPMIPAALVTLGALPTNVNGKIDRQALAALPIAVADDDPAGTRCDPPRGPVESMLAEDWCRILGVARVSRDDDFFAIGGHSLPAMMVAAAIDGRFGVRLPVRTVFDHPRLADLAAVIEAARPGVVEPVAGDAIAAPRVPIDLPALPAQRGMWVLQQILPDTATYNQPFAFRARGPIDWEEVRRRLDAAMTRHAALRTALVESDGALVQRVAPIGSVELPWEERAAVGPDVIDAVLVARAREPFDLAVAPLWRAILFPAAAPHGVLLLHFHHAIIDEWSLSLLLEELGAAIAPTTPAPSATLPPGGDAEEARRHWRRVLEGAPAAVSWPGKRRPSGPPTGAGAVVRFTIPADVVGAWGRIAQSARATLFHAWLGACHLWLRQATGSRDTVVLTPVANRADGAVVDAVGCFVNTLPVRLRDVPAGTTAGDVAAAMKVAFLDSIERGFLPFDEIVASVPGASGSRLQPLGNVALVYVERDGRSPVFSGTPMETVDVHTGTARFDLTLSLHPDVEGGHADGVVEYALDVLDEAAVRSLVEAFSGLLARVAADPGFDVGAPVEDAGDAAVDAIGVPADAPAEAGPDAPIGGPPRGATEATIARLWSDALGGIVVSRDDSFFELGGNSLLAIRIVHLVNRELRAAVTVRSLFVAPRLDRFAALVDRSRIETSGMATGGAGAGSFLVPLQPQGVRPTLVMVHGFGGGVSHFLPLAARLAPDIPVLGLMARSLADGTSDSGPLARLVAGYADEIERVFPGGTVHLCSHSHGGWIAFEMARTLRSRGYAVGAVILLDTHPGALLPAMGRMRTVPSRIADRLQRQLEWVRALRAGHVPRSLRRVVRRATGAAPEAPHWYRDGVELKNFRELVARHRTDRYDGRVDFVHASNARPTVIPMWRWLVGAGLRVHDVPILHHELCEERHADVIGRLIRGILDEIGDDRHDRVDLGGGGARRP